MNMIVSAGKGRDFDEAVKEIARLQHKQGVYYRGARCLDLNVRVMRLEIDGPNVVNIRASELTPEQSHAVSHYSDTFDWGNRGGAASQLALGLIYDATGDKALAALYHPEFRDRFITGWGPRWGIHSAQIKSFIELKQQKEGAHHG